MELKNKLWKNWLLLPEKWRFILIGGYNTVFSYLLFCLLALSLGKHFHYLLILAITHFISVSNSFLSFKFLVFFSKKNPFHEYIKVNIVYLGYLIANAFLLYLFKDIFHTPILLAQLICVLTLVILVYFSHKYFSFKQ